MRFLIRCLAVVAALGASGARADKAHVLRIATVAPEGTSWAREIKAFGREVEAGTNGQVKVKLVMGGIAGGELEMLDRIHRHQLDGAISGGMLCSRLGPSLRVLRMLGLFADRQEVVYVIDQLKQTVDAEFAKEGFRHIGDAIVGLDVLFSRTPLKTLDDLRKTRFWIWDLDEVVQKQLTQMGIPWSPSGLPDAAAMYSAKQVDGFYTVPGAALAFQWSAQAKYVSVLPATVLAGCEFITTSAYDALPNDARAVVLEAVAKLQKRFNDMSQTQDAALLDQLFAKQGLKPVAADSALRADFSRAAAAAVQTVGPSLVPPELLKRVNEMLAGYRAAHAKR